MLVVNKSAVVLEMFEFLITASSDDQQEHIVIMHQSSSVDMQILTISQAQTHFLTFLNS